MALVRDTSAAQLAFQVAGGKVDDFHVIRYRGTEGLCRLYRYDIDVATDLESVVFDDLVGKGATFTINTDFGTRWVHGVIARLEMTGEGPDQSYYRIQIMAPMWLLTHRYKSRIFQNLSVKEILQQVFTEAGIPSDRYSLDGISNADVKREFCVQYRETDYNFCCRMMEEYGIRWRFEQTEEFAKLVLDNGTSYPPIPGESPDLPYHPPTGMNVPSEHVFRFRLGQEVRPGAVMLNDFTFLNPGLKLKSLCDADRDKALEFYDYPGGYFEQGPGKDIAEMRCQEFECGRIKGVGLSNSPRLAAGAKFKLIEHPSETFNKEYMVTSVQVQGREAIRESSTGSFGTTNMLDSASMQALNQLMRSENRQIRDLAEALLKVTDRLKTGDRSAHRALTQWVYHAGQVARDLPATAAASGGDVLEALSVPNLLEDVAGVTLLELDAPIFECRFECIPADVAYRPPRVTPRPVIQGTQTAIVTGPEGEEIHTDEYGRVKVHFHWDREIDFIADSSCWIRVSQGFAGGNYGMMFLPRIGQEVIVDFLEGDPNKPMIVGRVYNKDHMPPYALPAEKTKSVIKTRSSKGGEGSNEIRFEDAAGEEQLLLYGQKDIHIRAMNDKVETIENDAHWQVNNNRVEVVKNNLSLEVTKGDLIAKIGRDQSHSVGGKVSTHIAGTTSIAIDKDVVYKFGGSHKHAVAQTYKLNAASIKLEATAGIELKCGGSSIVLTPAAIFIVGGPLVNINSGSGPPVAPVAAQATSPAQVYNVQAADSVKHGHDKRYTQDGVVVSKVAETNGETQSSVISEAQDATWIEIELVDELENPVPGEPYEIKKGDQLIASGTLDANGLAHVGGLEPGTYLICFPRRDKSLWHRA